MSFRMLVPSWRVALLVSAAIVAVSSLVIAVASSTMVTSRVPSVSEEQARNDLEHLFGSDKQATFVPEEYPSDPGTPTIVGDYRFVPYGFVGELHSDGVNIPEGVQTDDPSLIEASSLYREPGALPDGLRLRSLSTLDGHTESLIQWVFADESESDQTPRRIEIIRQRSGSPIDVSLQPATSERSLETIEIGDRLVVVEQGRPVPNRGNESGRSFVIVRSYHDGIEVWIESRYFDAETLIPIALSLSEERG